MLNKFENKRGFTLMEALIASSIFAMIASIAAAFFMNISRTERQSELTNGMYEDARIMMEVIAREVRQGTIDYEEYHSINVVGAGHYGINRGAYASKFFSPGYTFDDGSTVGGASPANLGLECTTLADPNNSSAANCDIAGSTVFTPSVDINMGKNPYNSLIPAEASAFCEDCDADSASALEQTELYLISSDGREKTIIGSKNRLATGTSDKVLVMLQMDGYDTDSNGIVDIFGCKTEYINCTPATPEIVGFTAIGIQIAEILANDESTITATPFIPLSPLRSSIKDLKFIVWPDEDPYKAFAEADVQFQPNVTVVLTLEPAAAEVADYPGTPPEITVQTTVSAGVKNELKTYPPTKDLSWL
ncbi:prepilin-type N-terminal cleavage/methylation domain-containing protein [Candidatus Peregrinibacteria bacterium]|jgi:prepilin-type N-terminal cleavage/methylation domain-containing protein|nr:prepilin-type N-terminal cleavage/methylation domain-containing protein [Candidatus Peregrinibacteria bacterium]MBT4056061.1 prepilin-type N-terminal cleavage/methylation domain-containing protein [Candidatus Peregrinibacteria bacterium]